MYLLICLRRYNYVIITVLELLIVPSGLQLVRFNNYGRGLLHLLFRFTGRLQCRRP